MYRNGRVYFRRDALTHFFPSPCCAARVTIARLGGGGDVMGREAAGSSVKVNTQE